jgi:hypothetical protein
MKLPSTPVPTVLLGGAFPAIVFLTLAGLLLASFLATVTGLTKSKNDDKAYSLSLLQMWLWTLVIAGSYFVLVCKIFLVSHLTGCTIQIAENLLWLMGISAGSAAGAGSLRQYRVYQRALAGRQAHQPAPPTPKIHAEPPAPAWWSYFTDGTDLSLPRVQMALWTVIAIVAYVLACAEMLTTVPAAGNIYNLPNVDTQLLTLMGVSHVAYVLMTDKK